MAYIASEQITVFPTTRRDDHKSNRLFSEASAVNLVNQLLDIKQFVISDEFNGSSSESFEFNIQGYYFRIDTCAHLQAIVTSLGSPNEVWANITLTSGQEQDNNGSGDSGNPIEDFRELDGQDDSGEYQGVVFSNLDESGTGSNKYSLKILAKENNAYVIPETSKVKFSMSRLFGDLKEIDGGTL